MPLGQKGNSVWYSRTRTDCFARPKTEARANNRMIWYRLIQGTSGFREAGTDTLYVGIICTVRYETRCLPRLAQRLTQPTSQGYIKRNKNQYVVGGGWSHIIFGAGSLLSGARISCKIWPTGIRKLMTGRCLRKKHTSRVQRIVQAPPDPRERGSIGYSAGLWCIHGCTWL